MLRIDWVQINALFTAIIAAFVGVALQARFDRKKEAKKKINQKEAYLRYWREELEYNKSILHTMKTFIGGPCIGGIWGPIQSLSKHFRKTAWESIVKESLLSDLPIEQQRFFRITNRSILDVSLEIDTRVANWDRIAIWENIDRSNENPQPVSLELFYENSNSEISQRIQYALENIKETLDKLPRTD